MTMVLLPSSSSFFPPKPHFQNPKSNWPHNYTYQSRFRHVRKQRFIFRSSNAPNPTPSEPQKPSPSPLVYLTGALLFVGFASARAFAEVSGGKQIRDVRLPIVCHTAKAEEEMSEGIPNSEQMDEHLTEKNDILENIEDVELKAALENFKSKTYSLTVPLRVVALRGSVPPSWIKEFISSQGRRLKLRTEFRGDLIDIFSDMSSSITKGNIEVKSAMAADVITVGDSWFSPAIKKGMIEPIQNVDEQTWFKGLSDKWKAYLRRDVNGGLNPSGQIWAAPYRWGSMVIAYKKSKFRKHNMAPIEDWSDLWRPELAGKISMVDSPREVVGAVLKSMGASYNTVSIDAQVSGGTKAVLQNFMLLQKQVRLFDSVNYLKSFAVGDVWVVVGWSSDVLPVIKRMSDVAVIVPKSGASLWVDLWAIPAASKFDTSRIGGRVRGPSPLVEQWIEFCLQSARALPFKQEVVPGASPIDVDDPLEGFEELVKGKPKLDTNLIAGVPPKEILDKCEFLEPLDESAVKEYRWLIDQLEKPGHGLIYNIGSYISSYVENLGLKMNSR